MPTFYVKTYYEVVSVETIKGWIAIEADDEKDTLDIIKEAEETALKNYSFAFLSDHITKEHQILFKKPQLLELYDEESFKALNELKECEDKIKSYHLTEDQVRELNSYPYDSESYYDEGIGYDLEDEL